LRNKIESVQILRGLAALSVVLFHYRFYLVPDGANTDIPDMLFSWGSIGVDLFFVISGFIMVYVTKAKPAGIKSSLDFIINRLTRIIPTYYILLLFAFLTGGAMSTFHYPDKTTNLISAMTFHPYLHQPAPLYIDENGMYNIRWTLNYELYFYFAFSVCLLFKKRLLALAAWFLAPVGAAYFLLPEITLSPSGYNFESVGAKFLTNPIILEFGIGVLTGYAYLALNKFMKSKYCMLSFACLIMISIGIIKHKIGGYNLLSALSFSFLVLCFALESEYIVKFTPRFFVTLGDISFSWYLLHIPLASFIAGKVEKANPNAMHSTLGFTVLLIASILVAFLSHKFIEVKLTNKIRSSINKNILFRSKKTNQGTSAS